MEQTYWVTKYALSSGIFSVTDSANEAYVDKQGYLHCKRPGTPSYGEIFGPASFAANKEAAQRKAAAMRAKKIASLKKQIAALEAMGQPA